MAARVVSPSVLDPGSEEWLSTTLRLARRAAEDADSDCSRLVQYAAELRAHSAWERALKDEPRTWERLCEEALGVDPAFVEAVSRGLDAIRREGKSGPVTAVAARERVRAMAADPEIAPLAPPKPAKGEVRNPNGSRGNNKGNNITLIQDEPSRGTGSEYLVRRLKRDAPEVAAELARGELPSARAAAIKAGIMKVPTIVERAFRLVERMKPAERLDFDRQIRPLIAATEEGTA